MFLPADVVVWLMLWPSEDWRMATGLAKLGGGGGGGGNIPGEKNCVSLLGLRIGGEFCPDWKQTISIQVYKH